MTLESESIRNLTVAWRGDLFIDNEFVPGEGSALDIENPATEETITTIAMTSLTQLDAAVASARRAFRSSGWRGDAALRQTVLARMADLMEARTEEFVAALVREVGTPIALCEPVQFGAALKLLRLYAQQAVIDRVRDLGPDGETPASASTIRMAPVGVVAAIGAYNYPLTLMIAKVAAALAAGCAVVYMPSHQTPLASLLFGEIARDAGLPAGLLNIVVGGPDIGAALTSHSDIDKVTFTGSVEVGRKVMIQAASGLKDVVLELGGKSAGIILPDADMEASVMPLHGRYMRNAGQGCQSPTRLLVPAEKYDDFIDLSRDVYRKVQIGDPWDPATWIGPLVSQPHRARVEGFIERSLDQGGRIVAGGGRPETLPKGWFLNATLIGGVDNHSEIACNELFGPVAVVMPYRTVDEAVTIANDSVFGLAAHIYGDLDEAKRVACQLEAGTVYINGGGQFRAQGVLSGWKQSGIGREWGEDGMVEFLEIQHIQWALT